MPRNKVDCEITGSIKTTNTCQPLPKMKNSTQTIFYLLNSSVLCMPWDRGIYTPWEAQFPCLSYCTSTHTLVPVLEAVVVTAVWTGKTEDTWTAPAVEAGPINCWPDEVWTIWNRLAAHTQKANEQLCCVPLNKPSFQAFMRLDLLLEC